MAKFDIRASIVETRAGEYLVMVSTLPRMAWSAHSDLEEAIVETRGEAQELCRTLVDHARDKIRGRGDELGELIGPESQPLAGQPEGQRSGS